MKKQSVEKVRYCECLDYVEASHRHRVYPLMYCHIRLSGHLDIDRLKYAVFQSAKIVPEIMLTFDFKSGCFINLGHIVDHIIMTNVNDMSLLRPDLSKCPQLRIIIFPHQTQQQMIIVMSHILSDGEGFLQYLYLLTALYNGEQVDMNIKNKRDISSFLKNTHVLFPTEQTKNNVYKSMPPLRPSGKASYYLCLKTQILADSMAMVRQKAKKYGTTINNVLITAYARVIARMTKVNTVVIPCPADLRRFFPDFQEFTVANMTGIYRSVVIEMVPGCTFTSTLQQVHLEMSLQKKRYRCFSGIKTLYRVFHKIPRPILGPIIKASYGLHPVSYTNFGNIDNKKLHFKNCTIQDCYFTGTFRLPPDFQLTVSTFKNICTLNCTMLGSSLDMENGQAILEEIKREILDWIENSQNYDLQQLHPF